MAERSLFDQLVDELTKIPGIGPKSAQRIAFYLIKQPHENVEKLAHTILKVKNNIKYCSICFNLTEKDPCEICSDIKRDHSTICVVSEPKDVWAIERTSQYNGLYHVLGGLISPLDGVFPEDLRIFELKDRVEKGGIKEVILATDSTPEGEATAMYIGKILSEYNVKVTRLAHGLPVGTELDFADELTLAHALDGRQDLKIPKD
ncbi:MAG TPA: recombination mediator RecR [Dictyoglomaceae bacterium]|nr:recombination mediator RecR [Dictyoglomaceae bacterium]HPU43695.1 recombination mediator RecR [Dictyoglomaceae bacterium]